MPESLPTGEAIIALSRENELVSEPMFIMRTVTSPEGMGSVLENMSSHLGYWAKMEQHRVLFAAGPVMPVDLEKPWSGEGLVIFRADSLAAARKIADDDPMHTSGARSYELEPWLLNHLVT